MRCNAEQDAESEHAPLGAAAPAPAASVREAQRVALAQRRAAVELCQRQYGEAAQGWQKALGSREVSTRALTETSADRSNHALDVGVISLLMGKVRGFAETDLCDPGVCALSLDTGKLELPHHLHRLALDFSSADIVQYRDPVAQGVTHGRRMGLAPGAARDRAAP